MNKLKAVPKEPLYKAIMELIHVYKLT